jgi:WD40-like Beta Propeller Repeat
MIEGEGEMGHAGEQRRWVSAKRRRVGSLLFAVALMSLACSATAQATAPVGSNGKIAYGRFIVSQSDVYTINPDGTAATNLTNTAAPDSEFEPSWSPSGAKIAFSLCNGGACDIAVMNADGSGVANLTNTPGAVREQRPAFSPDGQLIVYDRSDNTTMEHSIWVMNQDGTDQRPLTHTPTTTGSDFTPDFSPDGNAITFSRCFSGTPGQCDLWAMNADGTGQHPLTSTLPPNSELGGSYSPDGARIVFQLDQGNDADDDLWVMNADGSGARALTTTSPAGERRPVFSPDMTRLAFALNDGVTPQSEIYISDANAQGQLNLTNTFGGGESEQNPDWEDVQMCGRSRATIVGDDGSDRLLGTKARDVIDANAADSGKNVVKGRAGNDLICIAGGKAKVNCGKGARDKVISLGPGKHKAKGCERIKGKGFKKPGS